MWKSKCVAHTGGHTMRRRLASTVRQSSSRAGPNVELVVEAECSWRKVRAEILSSRGCAAVLRPSCSLRVRCALSVVLLIGLVFTPSHPCFHQAYYSKCSGSSRAIMLHEPDDVFEGSKPTLSLSLPLAHERRLHPRLLVPVRRLVPR